MIINFSVKNFRSIDDEITLSFEAMDKNENDKYYIYKSGKEKILKTAIIYGSNASGKTNILKALGFLINFIRNPLKRKDQPIELEPFLFTDEIKNSTYFELDFLMNDIKYSYILELSKERVLVEQLYFYNPRKALIFDRTNYEFGSKIKINKSQREALKNNTLHNNSILSGYLKTNIDIKELDNALTWFKKVLPPIFPRTNLVGFVVEQLEKKDLDKELILNILQNADFGIDDFNIKKSDIEEEFKEFLKQIDKEHSDLKRLEIFFTHIKKYKLEYDNESTGTQRYYQLSVILTLLLKESLILPIDELEASLHPDLLKHFLLSFIVNAKDSQLIFTTHSRELLLEKDILRQDIIWFTEKKDNHSTDLYSLSDFDTKTLRKESSIYNIYKSGKLGAIPNLKDYFLDI